MDLKKMWRVVGVPVVLFTVIVLYAGNNDNEHKERAQTAAQSFMGQLQNVLMEELRDGGPVKAIAVCADTAQVLTDRAGEELDVSLKRVSDRVRNSNNEPDEYEASVLKKFTRKQEEGETPPFIHTEVRTLNGEKEFWYMQSIHMQAQCLGCHGEEEQIADTVKKLLSEKYPDDRATGYTLGDFRGAIRVSFTVD